MDECIVELSKLLIWSDNTCKQKKKSEWEQGVERKSERMIEQI
jgi:hypothetical protein